MLSEKYEKLKEVLRSYKSVVLGFSGGVDSTFLLKAAYDVLGENVLAVTAVSPSYPKSELEEAKELAKSIGAKQQIINTTEMDDENYKTNPIDRCYYCKKCLWDQLISIAKDNECQFVLEASNIDDLGDYRPGLKAGDEMNVKAPLREANMTKDDIRQLSKQLNLPTWNKPAMACLSSRIPYGEEITPEKLERVDKAEQMIKALGIKQVRVRHHKDLARIEVGPDYFDLIMKNKDEISKQLKYFGFKYVSIDLQGYRTGAMNEVLEKNGN